MPASKEQADDEGTDPPAIVRVINEIVPATTQADRLLGRVLLTVIRTPSPDVVCHPTPVPHPPDLITSIPLCDSARLERSGVLLA